MSANAGDAGFISGLGRSLGEGNGTHFSILAWEIPRTEEFGWLQSKGLKKSWTQLTTKTHTHRGIPTISLSYTKSQNDFFHMYCVPGEVTQHSILLKNGLDLALLFPAV